MICRRLLGLVPRVLSGGVLLQPLVGAGVSRTPPGSPSPGCVPCCHLWFQSSVDFPPRLKRLMASQVGSGF